MQTVRLGLHSTNSNTEVNGVVITPREVDIIACLLSGKSTKAMAGLLSMSPRTIETHTRAIMLKFNCNSRQGIIELVEKSVQFSQLKNHYRYLLKLVKFKGTLQQIALLNKDKDLRYVISDIKDSKNFIDELIANLKLAGITIEKKSGLTLPNALFIKGTIYHNKDDNLVPVLFLVSRPIGAIPPDTLNQYLEPSLDLNTTNNFQEQVLLVIKKLLPNFSLPDSIIQEFANDGITIENAQPANSLLNHDGLKVKRFIALVVLLIMIICGFYIGFVKFIKDKNLAPISKSFTAIQTVRSSLFIPMEILERPKLLKTIEEKLADTPEENAIKTIALVGITGIGGVGKTTLARYYAVSHDYPLVWELNAETKESLLNSFNELAIELAQTQEQKNELELIYASQNSLYKENQLLLFVKHLLKQLPSWLLLYDNMENFTAVKQYLPDNRLMWGNGKVILTTRDGTIARTVHLKEESVIELGEVTPKEALTLYCKIFYNKEPDELSLEIQDGIQQFLKCIPAFPLDVSVAAYYIKNTGISLKEYLASIAENNGQLSKIQEEFLSSMINYDKTRYGIIVLSFKKIMTMHPKFADLLFYICLLDSQDIPVAMLSFYDKHLIESFLHRLRKFSLITSSGKSENQHAFSIHRSTQQVGLNFLLKYLSSTHKDKLLQEIAVSFTKYLESEIENTAAIKNSVNHAEKFLSHNLLKNPVRASLGIELGSIHYKLLDYAKAQKILQSSITMLNQYDYLKMAQALMTLGIINREIVGYEPAKQLLEKALMIYRRHFPKDYARICKTLVYLGQVNRNLGEYSKAEKLLQESLAIYQKELPKNHSGYIKNLYQLAHVYQDIGQYNQAQLLFEQSILLHKKYFSEEDTEMAAMLVYLGNLYRDFGQYEIAKKMLEKSLQLFRQQNIPEEHVDFAWAALYLGEIYRIFGELAKAQELLEKGYKVYQDGLVSDHVAIGIALEYLGRLYLDLDLNDKAQQCLEKSLVIYEKNYAQKPHIKIGQLLHTMGKLYMQKKAWLHAELYLKKALTTFEIIKHPNQYMVLESLSHFYMKKAEFDRVLHHKKADLYRGQAIRYLYRALEIINLYFNLFSYHTRRVQKKINDMHKTVDLQGKTSSKM